MPEPPTRAPIAEAGQAVAASPPATPPPLTTLRKRAEFLACARGRIAHTPGMVVQGRPRLGTDPAGARGMRVGFTASRKVGNSVARNRARRRLRAVARQVLPVRGREGWDYVLIARSEATAARPFVKLVADLERALDRLHGRPGP